MILMGVHDPYRPWAISRRVDMRTSVIRAWARENNIPVEAIGRISAGVRERYVEAMEGQR